jgi:hypothetical protein
VIPREQRTLNKPLFTLLSAAYWILGGAEELEFLARPQANSILSFGALAYEYSARACCFCA